MRHVKLLAIIMAGAWLTACTPAVQQAELEAGDVTLVWPPAPAEPRIAYLYSFATPDDVGIRKSFTQRLGELISGPSEVRLVRPMAVVVDPEGTVYVADPGVEGVHRFDLKRARYRLIRGVDQRPLPSPVGLAVGLVGEVVPAERFEEAFVAYCRKIAEVAPLASRQTKRLVTRAGLLADLEGHLRDEVDLATRALTSEDGREAIKAIFQKRKPQFTGR